jgi:hypothetical protein
MLSAAAQPTERPVRPSVRQPTARVTNVEAKWVTRLLWLLLLINIVWAGIIIGLTIRLRASVGNWNFFAEFKSTGNIVEISLHIGNIRWSRELQNVLALLFIAVI